jgi:hypothetical protein
MDGAKPKLRNVKFMVLQRQRFLLQEIRQAIRLEYGENGMPCRMAFALALGLVHFGDDGNGKQYQSLL